MKLKGRLDTTNFNAAMRELSKRTKLTLTQVMRAEAGSVLTAAAKRTKETKAKTINDYFRRNTPNEGNKNATAKSGNARFYKIPGVAGSKGLRGFHWRIKNDEWTRYQANQKRKRQELLRRRGLSRQSILNMADTLGIKINEQGLSQARKALYRGRKRSHASRGVQMQMNKNRLVIRLENYTPGIRGSRMNAAFKKSIAGRVGYLRRNIKHGVFDSMQKVARAYPGLKTF